MEPLTSAGAGRRAWPAHVLLLGLLALGPANVARVTSLFTSIITFPLTRQLRLAGNRYEIFNTQLLFVYFVALMGLNLLKQAGLLNLGVSAVFGFGAYFTAIATVSHGWSYWLAVPLATIGAGAIGLLLGLPALRLGVFTFAMVTLGYAYVFGDLANQWADLTGGQVGLSGIKQPKPFDTLERYYWLLAIVVVIVYALAHNYLRSPAGRSTKAVAGNPIAAQSLGISLYLTKLRAFAVSSLGLGLAGTLYAPLIGFVAPDSFTANFAVIFTLMVVLGGTGTVAGPLIGGLILFRVPLEVERIAKSPGEWSQLLYGGVLLASVYLFPRGLMSGWWWLRNRFWGRKNAKSPAIARSRADLSTLLEPVERSSGPALQVVGAHKNLGGVQALKGIDLTVEAASVHALIGPNGSGKTTFLNGVSGYLELDQGSVTLLGDAVDDLPTHRRAARGLARTFQTPFVFEEMSCLENVLTALDRHRERNLLAYTLRLPSARREERAQFDRANSILTAIGLAGRRGDAAKSLPPGERRLLELARVIAINPRIVLMDEPAAGLSEAEIAELGEIIVALREAGIAVLIVEHHVDFLMRLADVVTVIDFGEVIAHGLPEVVRADPRVIEAYLGVDDAELDHVLAEEALSS